MPIRIAISQRVDKVAAYDETRDALDGRWSSFLSSVLPGALLYPVPNGPDSAADWLARMPFDGLVLSGGNSLSDAPERDATERILFDHFLALERPVFGVCRGLQHINVLLGGGLPLPVSPPRGHIGVRHRIELTAPPFAALGGEGAWTHNSYHGEYVPEERLSPELAVFARSEDGLIEGVCHKRLPVLAVQWHPERAENPTAFDAAIVSRLFVDGAFWRDGNHD